MDERRDGEGVMSKETIRRLKLHVAKRLASLQGGGGQAGLPLLEELMLQAAPAPRGADVDGDERGGTSTSA